MSGHVTIAEIRSRHQREERRLILGALERNKWVVQRTARDLEVAEPTLRGLIEQHGLDELRAQHALPRGRPRKAAPTKGAP